MEELIKKFADVGHCPIRNVVSHFSSKWGILIILVLGEAPSVRFNELTRILPDISPKVLSNTLKALEADNLISRKMYACIPPRVEYSITEKGRTLLPILQQLAAWGSAHLKK